MTNGRKVAIVVCIFSCATQARVWAANDSCPELMGKDVAARAEYLRGDPSKLAAPCIVNAIRYVGGKGYLQGSSILERYLDFKDPEYVRRTDAKASMVFYLYPAVDALSALGKPVLPELVAIISSADSPELVRHNAAETVALIYGAKMPVAIHALVEAAKVQADPNASMHLADEARRLANKCIPEWRNECEVALFK